MSDTDFYVGAFVGAALTGAVAMEYAARNRVEIYVKDRDVFEPIE